MEKLLEWQNTIVAISATIGGLLAYFGYGFVANRIGDPEARKARGRAKAGRLAVKAVILWLAERGNNEEDSKHFTLGQMMDASAAEQFKWPQIKESDDGATR